MADSSGKVAKLVQQKLEDYFNRQRVENEFDPSGKGIHTTTPLVVPIELSYLQAAERQWKVKKKKTKKNCTKKTSEQGVDSEADQAKDGESSSGGSESTVDVSPRVTKNSKIKSRVKGSEIERITQNAQYSLSRVSVDKIQSIHRYRPHLIPKEYLDLEKAAHVSHHVDAILNTEHAWDYAEEYDGRETTRKCEAEKNESESKERECTSETKTAEATTGAPTAEATKDKRRKTPLWLRVEMKKARKDTQSEKRSSGKPKRRNNQETFRNHEEADVRKEGLGEQEALGEDVEDTGKKIHQTRTDGDSQITETAGQKETGSQEERMYVPEKKEGSKLEFDDEGNRLGTDSENNDQEKSECNLEQGESTQSKSDAILQNDKQNHDVRGNYRLGYDKRRSHQQPSPKLRNDDRRKKRGRPKSERVEQSVGKEGKCSAQDVRAVDRKITERGDEVNSDSREVGMKEQGGDEGRKVGSSKENKTPGQDVKTEEYIRTESMVSLTNVDDDDDDDEEGRVGKGRTEPEHDG